MYDITVVSPRSYFLHTALLPSCITGTVEEGSVVTPMRRLVDGKARFLEAECRHVDPARRIIRCSRDPAAAVAAGDLAPGDGDLLEEEADADGRTFSLHYDLLVYAVGASTSSLDCPGAAEFAYFLRDIGDARRVREQIFDNVEKAALPTTTDEERAGLLTLVVVGGGPTGVKVVTELAGFVRGEASRVSPSVAKYARLVLVSDSANPLARCSREVAEQARRVFESAEVEVLGGHRVAEVTAYEVAAQSLEDGAKTALRYGCLVWATGSQEHSLTAQLKDSLRSQGAGMSSIEQGLGVPATGVVTDGWLQVRGSCGEIFALGDASHVCQDQTLPFAQELFLEGDVDQDGRLSMPELAALLQRAYRRFPQLEEYALYLREHLRPIHDMDSKADEAAERERRAQKRVYDFLRRRVGQEEAHKGASCIAADLCDVCAGRPALDLASFRELLRRVDANIRPLPPSAEVAAQQGHYLAKLFAQGALDGGADAFRETAAANAPFAYFHKGSLAYLGGSGLPQLRLPASAGGDAETITAPPSWKGPAFAGTDWPRGSAVVLPCRLAS